MSSLTPTPAPTPTCRPHSPALTRVPPEIWQLIILHALSIPAPPGQLIHPPLRHSLNTPGQGTLTLQPFLTPHMHWNGLRSPIACAYTNKHISVRTRARLAAVCRGWRDLVHSAEVWKTQVEWMVLPMDMDARRAIISLADERPWGKVGSAVRRLEFAPGAADAGVHSSGPSIPWSRQRPEAGLLRRIVGHCEQLREIWCSVELPGLVTALLGHAGGRTLRVFSYSGMKITPGEIYSLLAHCPVLEVLRFTHLSSPPAPATARADGAGAVAAGGDSDFDFLPYGPLPPLSLRTLSFSLSGEVDMLLGWMGTLDLPKLEYVRIEREHAPPSVQTGAHDQNENDLGAQPLPAQQQQHQHPQEPYMRAWITPPSASVSASTGSYAARPAPTEPPLPPGLHSFFHTHGPTLKTLEALESLDPLLSLPSLGWALLPLCPNLEQLVLYLPGAAAGIAGYPRGHASLKEVGFYGFWLDPPSGHLHPSIPPSPGQEPGPLGPGTWEFQPAPDGHGTMYGPVPSYGEEETCRRTRVHLENVLDAVIGLIGGDFPSLERLRLFDVQRSRVSMPVVPPVGPSRIEEPGPAPNAASTHPAFPVPHSTFPPTRAPTATYGNLNQRVSSPGPAREPEQASDDLPPEYARTLQTMRQLCVANNVRLEDAQGQLVDDWAVRRWLWCPATGLS